VTDAQSTTDGTLLLLHILQEAARAPDPTANALTGLLQAQTKKMEFEEKNMVFNQYLEYMKCGITDPQQWPEDVQMYMKKGPLYDLYRAQHLGGQLMM